MDCDGAHAELNENLKACTYRVIYEIKSWNSRGINFVTVCQKGTYFVWLYLFILKVIPLYDNIWLYYI